MLAAAGGAPTSWIGMRLIHGDDAPSGLKSAVNSLLTVTARANAPITDQVSVTPNTQPVTIIVVDALRLRRRPTDIRALLCSALQPLVQQGRQPTSR